MTVTMVAGHLKPFDIGKWIGFDEGGFWCTWKLADFRTIETRSGEHAVVMEFAIGVQRRKIKRVGLYDYIEITADTSDGRLPNHLIGIRMVELDGSHGDLKPQ